LVPADEPARDRGTLCPECASLPAPPTADLADRE